MKRAYLVYCWGANHDGSLGNGTTDPRLAPTPVPGGLRFAQVSAGITHTCGDAVTRATGTITVYPSDMGRFQYLPAPLLVRGPRRPQGGP